MISSAENVLSRYRCRSRGDAAIDLVGSDSRGPRRGRREVQGPPRAPAVGPEPSRAQVPTPHAVLPRSARARHPSRVVAPCHPPRPPPGLLEPSISPGPRRAGRTHSDHLPCLGQGPTPLCCLPLSAGGDPDPDTRPTAPSLFPACFHVGLVSHFPFLDFILLKI